MGSCIFEILPETRELILSNYYEREERSSIRDFLRRDAPVVEIGGSQGIVACTTNRLLRDPILHVVVEANPDLLPLLTRNRNRNRCKFQIIHAAVAPGRETVRFYLNEDPLKGSSLLAEGRPCDVGTITLAKLCGNWGSDCATLVCDIEGTEIELIEAEAEVLRRRFELLIVEFHPAITGAESVRTAIDTLVGNGFSLISIQRHVHVFRRRKIPVDAAVRIV
jgi:FkbM family methyltransferase